MKNKLNLTTLASYKIEDPYVFSISCSPPKSSFFFFIKKAVEFGIIEQWTDDFRRLTNTFMTLGNQARHDSYP